MRSLLIPVLPVLIALPLAASPAVQAKVGGKAKLVAVSKTFDAGEIEPVLAAGQRVFGENRVQEALGKWPELRTRYPDVELHLIGPLQSNKAAEAVKLFDVIQTIDRPKILVTLSMGKKSWPKPVMFSLRPSSRKPGRFRL